MDSAGRNDDRSTIVTVPGRCRVCYTCVRECPAKAIRIVEGEADVLDPRCIGCGNCVRVCSQGAKEIVDSTARVRKFLGGEKPVAALVAPSFPADFEEFDPRELIAMIRALGFDWVHEVSFGADLVAAAFRDLLANAKGRRYIASSCPAAVLFVEKYHPRAVDAIAPIVSPMVAMARVARRLHGDGIETVFIGPCSAKKCEGADEMIRGDVDAVLTYAELQRMFDEDEIVPGRCEPSDFDPPLGGLGQLFPISRGMLQAADIQEDLMEDSVVAAEGRTGFVEAIKEFVEGELEARLLEVLACRGCVMGAGMHSDTPFFRRRNLVSRYARQRMRRFDREAWQKNMDRFADLDLSRRYRSLDQRLYSPDRRDVKRILERLGKPDTADELNCGACGYDTCVDHAVAIFKGLAEGEMCLPYTIDKLRKTVNELTTTSRSLESTQEALMHSERLASMGQLAAGIAHEVNNPLGVVLMYAHLLLESAEGDSETREDLAMIAEQADRCKKIVAGLLDFARQNKVLRQPTDVRSLVTRTLQSVPLPDTISVTERHEARNAVAEVDGDQIVQVLGNLIGNAVAAMPEGGTLAVRTSDTDERIRIEIQDSGTGIPEAVRAKIFEPFFTTKQIGKGTGLGLSVTYGIVKMHQGDIRFETNTDPDAGPTGTTFIVDLPRRGATETHA